MPGHVTSCERDGEQCFFKRFVFLNYTLFYESFMNVLSTYMNVLV